MCHVKNITLQNTTAFLRLSETKPISWSQHSGYKKYLGAAFGFSGRVYGGKKAECERILAKANIDYRILRPALVYGRFDHTDRFYYWLYQVKMNKTLLLPDNGNRLFSITYVDDLVESIVESLIIDSDSDIYNVISEPILSIEKIVKTLILL